MKIINKFTQVGGRLKEEQRTIKYATSEIRVIEVLDDFCESKISNKFGLSTDEDGKKRFGKKKVFLKHET